LFAYEPGAKDGDVVFEKGNFIIPYLGELLTDKQFNKRYRGKVACVYVMTEGNTYYDAALYRSAGASSNDGNISGLENNAEFGEYNDLMGLVASRKIYQNQEILTHYGEEYWTGCKSEHRTYRKSVSPTDVKYIGS